MHHVKVTLTITHDGSFFVGLFEKVDSSGYMVAKYIFGAEPSGPEVLNMVLHEYDTLVYSKPIAENQACTKATNPKRALRDSRKAQLKGPNISKAQEAMRISIEENKKQKRTKTKEENEYEKQQKYNLKVKKRKEKKKGH